MKTSATQQALEKFYIAELIRYFESQRHHGKTYLEAILRVWRERAKNGRMARAYAEALRQLETKS